MDDGSYYTVEKLINFLNKKIADDGSEIEKLYKHHLKYVKGKSYDDFIILKVSLKK